MASIAGGVRIHVDLQELRRKMELLGGRVSTNVARRGLLAGAALIRDDARQRVAVRTGALKKAIIAETDRKGSTRDRLVANVKIAPKAYTISSNGKARAVSRAVQKARGKRSIRGEIYPRSYAHLVEYGTRPHAVGKGSRLARAAVTGGGKRKARAAKAEISVGAMHPGTQPRPFLRPAYDGKGDEARQLVERVIRTELQKELDKLGQTAGKGSVT